MNSENSNIGPALFFCVNGDLLFHVCSLEEAEPYGMFSNFPHSHYDVWNKNYENKYGVEFDYYPRGRVVYRSSMTPIFLSELPIILYYRKLNSKKIFLSFVCM